MIKILGLKRIVIVLVLIGINCCLGAALYLYLTPELQSTEQKLRSVSSQESAVKGDIANIQLEFEQLAEQQNEFEDLKRDGFFSNQSRKDAQDVFLAAKQYSGISDAIVTVRPGSVVQNENAAKADQVLLESPVEITFTSVDDIDIYEYVNYLNQKFPGYLSIDSINISRKSNLNETILRAVATGMKPPLVEARLFLTWRTMVSRDAYLSSQTDGTGEYQ